MELNDSCVAVISGLVGMVSALLLHIRRMYRDAEERALANAEYYKQQLEALRKEDSEGR